MYIFDFGYIIAPIVTVFYYFLIEAILLDFNINRRAKEMEKDAIYVK